MIIANRIAIVMIIMIIATRIAIVMIVMIIANGYSYDSYDHS